jgi:hypothetical protein
MTDLTRAIALNASDAPSFVARGDVFNAKGDSDRAIGDYDRSLSLTPDNRYAQEMKRQAVAAKSELAKVNPPFRAGATSAAPRTATNAAASVVPALPGIGALKEFPDRPVKQDNDSAGGLRIRFSTPWSGRRFGCIGPPWIWWTALESDSWCQRLTTHPQH